MTRAAHFTGYLTKTSQHDCRTADSAGAAIRRAAIETLESRVLLAAFMVDSTLDYIAGEEPIENSLRWAIQQANQTNGLDVILFDTVGTIYLRESLPSVTDETFFAGVDSGPPQVTIDASSTMGSALILEADRIEVTGLYFTGFFGAGIEARGDDAWISRCVFTGFDYGIDIRQGADGARVEGNIIGMDPYGSEFGTTDGIRVAGKNTSIGGPAAYQRNIISGNRGNGIWVLDTAGDGTIQGNWIGTDASGLYGAGNYGNGIYIQANASWLVGGSGDGAGNIISSNYGDGIRLDGASRVTVQGNGIGLDGEGGASPYAYNRGAGVWLTNSSDNVVGGAAPGQGNIIFGSSGDGVTVESGIKNTIRGNSIYGNYGIGIDLGWDGVTLNDSAGHDGANHFHNFPVITSASISADTLVVSGSFQSWPSETFLLDLYASDQANWSGHGEGQTYLGAVSVTTDADGLASFTATFSGFADETAFITATATDASGNTSEFSQAAAISAATEEVPTTTTLAAHNPLAVYGDITAFTANVIALRGTDVPTGSILFSCDDGAFQYTVALDASGSAMWSFSGLSAGLHTITATYLPEGVFLASDAALTQNVGRATLTVTADNQSRVYGTANPELTGSLAGIQYCDDVSATYATAATISSDVGVYAITPALNDPAGKLANYEVTVISGVLAIQQAASETSMATSVNPSGVGETVILTATVAAESPTEGVPTGTVVFRDESGIVGTAALVNGVATLTLADLSAGDHVITAEYVGDLNFLPSVSDEWLQVVESPFSIRGRVFSDITGNGLTDDDLPMSGVTVQLYADANDDGVLGSGDGGPVATITSGSDGSYGFAPDAEGRFFIQEVVPGGYVRTHPTLDSYYTVDAVEGTAANLDFANYVKSCPCALTNIVYTVEHCGKTKTVTDLRGNVKQGDTVSVTFTVKDGTTATVSLVSYLVPSDHWVPEEAYEQRIYDSDIAYDLDPGTYTLSVEVPEAYFQVDFVCGLPIDHFGPAGSNITYSSQGRLYSADNGGNRASIPGTSSLSGVVFLDEDGDGVKDHCEDGIPGVIVHVLDAGGAVLAIAKTDACGVYDVDNLFPGTYSVRQIQPRGFVDGDVTVGSLGGEPGEEGNLVTGIAVGTSQSGQGYNFAELSVANLMAGDMASIGFWNGANGQKLIKSLNGSASSRKLATWLSGTYPGLYGRKSANNLVSKNNNDVASLFRRLFGRPDKLDAQVLAVALATYATRQSLGGAVALKYGFTVWSEGSGSRRVDVGEHGAAFGVDNGTTMSISQVLAATSGRASKGVLFGGNAVLRAHAASVFEMIIELGDLAT